MCWSGQASTVLAVAGISTSAYCYRKGEPKALCATLVYFSLMEVLQAYTYTVIGDCANRGNQIATMLGYMHIAFQPFFINAASMYFLPDEVRRRISKYVYGLCFVIAALGLLRMYPFADLPYCYQLRYGIIFCDTCSLTPPFCGKEWCSYPGSWHIAWAAPLKSSVWMDNAYLTGVFLLPLICGSWKMTAYQALTGPLLALLTSNSANEWIAVWCLYSVAIFSIVAVPPLRKYLHVKKWFWWRLLKLDAASPAD